MKNKQLVTIGAIQFSMEENLEANLEKALKKVEEAARKEAQIICLPELYRSLYFAQEMNKDRDEYSETIPGKSTEAFSALAKKYEVVIILPLYEKTKDNHYYNSVVVIDEKGRLLDTYRKIHIPYDPLFYEKEYFEEGNLGYKIYKTKYGNFAVLICYDQWFPEAARMVALQGADIIFYPTAIGNIIDFKCPEGDWHEAWETIQRAHAIANSVYVVSVNRVGVEDQLDFWGQSFICDSFGKIIGRASSKEEEIIISEIDLSKNESIRKDWGFFENRRTDTYEPLLKQC